MLSAVNAICVTRGLKASSRKFERLSLESALAQSQRTRDCYELSPERDAPVSPFFDFDGTERTAKGAMTFTDEDDFLRQNATAREACIALAENAFAGPLGGVAPHCSVMQSSSWEARKISFRVVIRGGKALAKNLSSIIAACAEARGFVQRSADKDDRKDDRFPSPLQPKLHSKRCLFADGTTFPLGLELDLCVYDQGRKMRMLHSSKDGEPDRPLTLVHGEAIDTIFSAPPSDAVDLPLPWTGGTGRRQRDEAAECAGAAHQPKRRRAERFAHSDGSGDGLDSGDPFSAEADEANVDPTGSPGSAPSAPAGPSSKRAVAIALGHRPQSPCKLKNKDGSVVICFPEATTCPRGYAHKEPGKGFYVASATGVVGRCKGERCATEDGDTHVGAEAAHDVLDALGITAATSREAAISYERRRGEVDAAVANCTHRECARLLSTPLRDVARFSTTQGWATCCDASKVWTVGGVGRDAPPALRKRVGDDLSALFSAAHAASSVKKATAAAVRNAGTVPFIAGVLKVLEGELLDEGFSDRLDGSPSLLAFLDAVVDLDDAVLSPRAIRPNDWISITTGYAFPSVPPPASAAAMRAFLSSTFSSAEDVACFLRYAASQLHGVKTHELFFIWIGPPRAGKGAAAAILARALGGYAGTWQISMLTTKKRAAEGPEPALISARRARLMMTTEPDKDAPLQTGFVKQLVGRDPIFCRDMYAGSRGMVSYVPRFGLIIQTNGSLEYNAPDAALTCKQRAVPFAYSYVDNPSKSNERKRDNLVKEKCAHDDGWRDAFMSTLLEVYFAEVRGARTLAESPSFALASRRLAGASDPVAAWLESKFAHDPARADDAASWRPSAELYDEFLTDTERGERDMSMRAWSSRMSELGVCKSSNPVRLGHGQQVRVWKGLFKHEAGEPSSAGGEPQRSTVPLA